MEMDRAKNECVDIDVVERGNATNDIHELNDLQLACIGGGIADVVFG
jgi:hypothetical protein